jgi:hypothetical protein
MKKIMFIGLLLICFGACDTKEKKETAKEFTMVCTRVTPYENATVIAKAVGDDITVYTKEIVMVDEFMSTLEEYYANIEYLQKLVDEVNSAMLEYRYDEESNEFWYKETIHVDEAFKIYADENFSSPEGGTTFYYSLEKLNMVLEYEGGYICETK